MSAALAIRQVVISHEPLSDASTKMPAKEAAELRWFYGSGGVDRFRATPFEAQLERMRLFARPKRCPTCRGEGFVPLDPKRWVKATELEVAQQVWLGKPKRYLVTPRSRGVSLRSSGECRRCGGIGWIEAGRRRGKHAPLTARTRCVRGRDRWGSVPLGSGGVSLSDVDVVRLARVQRRLIEVGGADPELLAVLERYYEPTGGQKLRALWELVPAGRTLLRRNELELTPLAFFANVCAAQAERYDAQVGALIAACDAQAAERLAQAVEAWNRTATRRAP